MNIRKKRLPKSGRSVLSYAEEIAEIHKLAQPEDSDAQLLEQLASLAKSPDDDEKTLLAAFARLQELLFRKTGLRLFDTQLAAALALFRGKLVELPTGEGKTAAAVLPAAFAALRGRTVHVLVSNDYLAKRDYDFAKGVYAACGLTAGVIRETTPKNERKQSYQSAVLYSTAKEVGFDLLRDFLCLEKGARYHPALDYAIIDEADSILIDEAAVPLVIAGNTEGGLVNPYRLAKLVARLGEAEVAIHRADRQVYLTDEGIAQIEKQLQISNLYAQAHTELRAMLHAALYAEFLLLRDRDYLVRGDEVQLIDPITGRIARNRRFPDALHGAVEAKEHLVGTEEGMVYNTMCMQAFLSRYRTLSGMSGTLQTSAKELRHLYGLEVEVIPPHIPCVRRVQEDLLFLTDQQRDQAAVQQILAAWAAGRPVLAGTQSVLESEQLSRLLRQAGVPHVVLNAKQDEKEAELIAQAGEPGRVTVSTNMAGRGVDIKLGGPAEENRERVVRCGGLLVLGFGINRSRRVDNQLRGRAGRQGDPGESRFFISLQDPLLTQYGFSQEAAGAKLSPQNRRRFQKEVRRVQRYAEGEDAEARYMLGRYSYILEQQRKVLEAVRDRLLNGETDASFQKEMREGKYDAQMQTAGLPDVQKAWCQLSLYYSNLCWAQYLSSMGAVRDGIHLVVVGGKNPIDEYHRLAISCFEEMWMDWRTRVQAGMSRLPISENGVELEKAGLCGATTTWTYLIDESVGQFGKRRMPSHGRKGR